MNIDSSIDNSSDQVSEDSAAVVAFDVALGEDLSSATGTGRTGEFLTLVHSEQGRGRTRAFAELGSQGRVSSREGVPQRRESWELDGEVEIRGSRTV